MRFELVLRLCSVSGSGQVVRYFPYDVKLLPGALVLVSHARNIIIHSEV